MKRSICLFISLIAWVVAYSHDSKTVFDMRNGLPENRIRAVCQMTDGRMAIATTATVEIYDGTRFHSFPLNPQMAYPLPDYTGKRHLLCDSSGYVWLRNDRTLFVIDTNKGEIVEDVAALIKQLGMSDTDIASWEKNRKYEGDTTAFVKDSYGATWLGTREQGILYINEQRARQFATTADSFVYNRRPNYCSARASRLSVRYAPSATNCTLDTDSYSYLGTRNGVIIINRQDNIVGTINEDYGLLNNNIASMLADHNGNIWVATAGGGISRLTVTGSDSLDITNYSFPDGIRTQGNEFRTCQIHRNDSTGIITVGFVGGTIIFHPDSVKAPCYTFHFPSSPAVANNHNKSLYLLLICACCLLILIIFILLYFRKKRPVTVRRANSLSSDITNTAVDNAVQQMSNKPATTTADEIFLSKLQQAIEEHLGDESFSVQQLSEIMAMDRTVLYRRMQQLTNTSPSVYIKQIRMNVAERLLRETTMTVSDIARQTGFSTAKYFSSAFKETFGKTPLEYRASNTSS